MTPDLKRICLSLLTAALLALLIGCGGPGREEAPGENGPGPAEEVQETETPRETALLPVSGTEDIQKEIGDAIRELRQPAEMDVSTLALGETAEMEIKNLYYALLSQHPEFRYAYDLSAELENGCLRVRIAYMPYKTGIWPEGWEGLPVSDLRGLLAAAEEHMGAEPFPIRLTDPSLTPDEMSAVLRQAGGGYILCALSRDGTEIICTPAVGMTMEECLSRLEQAEALAHQAAEQTLTDGMTERERAAALYGYLTETVQYDRRYYSDRAHMPFESQTALGALRDGVAVCGGYALALELLFREAGIPCYTVSGKCGGENHMWNIARLDGKWLWFDATADRGLAPRFEPRHFALEELEERYSWDSSQIDGLIAAVGKG